MKTFLTLFFCLTNLLSFSQAPGDLPPNAEAGKCYAKCIEPDIYEEEVVKVMTKPAYNRLEVVPAEYKTVTETILNRLN